ncbi:DUF721 domain-containing protein [Prosthecobacter sp.]|uniref:DUF721 domain-containing protein n=1 Tax=Prosthecobacter sp. TaxID=1965333 RepID=UPI002AB97D76|nr:DUF721 domain-containing protein [Prosthecobacter sp.]MDZ4403907.1 DUF721 domain-containing protein [Prosthecobacter sp.]
MNNRKPTATMRLRHNLLSAWRGVDNGPLIDLPTLKVGDLATQIMAKYGMANRVKLEDILAAWEEIVGTFLFKMTRPDAFERGVLTVRLMQPTAHHALSLEKVKILKRLQEKLPDAKIRDIRFRHG